MAELTPAERERISKLNEELSESMERMGLLIQAMAKAGQTISKILLHGYTGEFQGQTWDNRGDLMRELGDVEAAKQLMADYGDIDLGIIRMHGKVKRPKITKYMDHQTGNFCPNCENVIEGQPCVASSQVASCGNMQQRGSKK